MLRSIYMSAAASRTDRAVHWFRSDLRLRDNTALAAAAADSARELVLLFVLDERLLRGDALGPPRLRFLLDSLARLGAVLAARGQRLVVKRGVPEQVIPALLRELGIDRIHWNRDYGPFARRRDAAVRAAATAFGVTVHEHKDRVVFESHELRTKTGGPFQVYTPFRNAWWERWHAERPALSGPLRLPPPIATVQGDALPTASSLGVVDDATQLPTAGEDAAARRLDRFLAGPIRDYLRDRDRPDIDGTSRLSPYLRFGAISVRTCVHAALEVLHAEPRARDGARKWIDELIWREFYHAILSENPHVLMRCYRAEYDALAWDDDDASFRAWCAGRTGYPFVDAAMRQLAASGWMHNRARMVVASFLTKDLGIDWRRGERFLYQRLVDGDPASNNGGWQWAASTGTDAQPYFRIFHPVTQGERFDPEGAYVRRFVPELRDVELRFLQKPWQAPSPPRGYPSPIVDHAERRIRALRRFEAVRAGREAPAAEPPDRKPQRGKRGRNLELF